MSGQGGAVWRILDRVHRRPEVPVVLCIDVEPDPLVFDPADPPPWLGFERLVQRLPALRRRLSEITGAPAAFTWCLRMDPQVAETWGSPAWVAERYEGPLAELTGAGDELGLHTHVWRWETKTREWVADFADPAWGEHCVEMGLDAFETSFGRGCAAHRGGTFFLSGAMLSKLETRGVAVDLTVEPGLGPLPQDLAARGPTPDYRGAPSRPYRSTPSKFPAADPAAHAGPLIVPLLSAPRRRPPFRRMPLLLEEVPKVFRQRLFAALARQPQIVGFAIRSDYVLASKWEVIQENLDHLANRHRMVFTTASAAAELWAA